MGVLIPVGYGQASIHWRQIGATKDSVSTIGYNPTTLDPSTDAESIYNALWDGTGADRVCNVASMTTAWQFLGVTCTEMDDSGPLVGEFFTTVTGSNLGAPPVVNLAVLVRKNTAAGGRKNRGRMFVPPIGMGENQVDGLGNITSDYTTQVQGQWDLFLSTMIDVATLPPVILHSSVGTPTPIVSFSVQSLAATQRRRLR